MPKQPLRKIRKAGGRLRKVMVGKTVRKEGSSTVTPPRTPVDHPAQLALTETPPSSTASTGDNKSKNSQDTRKKLLTTECQEPTDAPPSPGSKMDDIPEEVLISFGNQDDIVLEEREDDVSAPDHCNVEEGRDEESNDVFDMTVPVFPIPEDLVFEDSEDDSTTVSSIHETKVEASSGCEEPKDVPEQASCSPTSDADERNSFSQPHSSAEHLKAASVESSSISSKFEKEQHPDGVEDLDSVSEDDSNEMQGLMKVASLDDAPSIAVLLMNPILRQFEVSLVKLISNTITVGTVLSRAIETAKDRNMTETRYMGLCDMNGEELGSSLFISNLLQTVSQIVLAMPEDMTSSECARMARNILSDAKVSRMLRSNGIRVHAVETANADEVTIRRRKVGAQRSIAVLFVNPSSLRFELSLVKLDSKRTVVADILPRAIKKVTDKRVLEAGYTGICDTNGKEPDISVLVSDLCNASSQVALAIPEGMASRECARRARPILSDSRITRILARNRIAFNLLDLKEPKDNQDTMERLKVNLSCHLRVLHIFFVVSVLSIIREHLHLQF